MSFEDSKKVVEAYLKALGDKDLPMLLEVVAHDAEYVIPGRSPLGGTWRGQGQILQSFVQPMAELFDPTAPYVTEVVRIFGTESDIAVECVTTSRTRRGLDYRNPIVALFTVRDSKIVRVAEYFDTELFQDVLYGAD